MESLTLSLLRSTSFALMDSYSDVKSEDSTINAILLLISMVLVNFITIQ